MITIKGSGDDTLTGDEGSDILYAGNGDDILDGGSGNDLLLAGNGDDILDGGSGNDLLLAGNGNDYLDGGSGDDYLDGGNGDDRLIYDLSENLGSCDLYAGGRGSDTLVLELTHSQSLEDSVQQDIENFKAFLAAGSGWFQFSSFDLRASGFEKLELVILDSGPTTSEPTSSEPSAPVYIAPVAQDDSHTTDERSAVGGNVLANDTDVDVGDTLLVSSAHGQSANVGTQITLESGALLTLNADGS